MITLCKHNNFHEDIAIELDKREIAYTIEKCLYRCNVCHMKPMLKDGDTFFSEDTIEGLIKKLKL